ncbi:MAG: VOC family protein [Chloroflexi bacterium]|nr:VOC family protein [Chloroflexota bacterium]
MTVQECAIKTRRISHPALICQDIEATLEFYTSVLGMEPIAWQPNPDDPSFTSLYLHAGEGTILAFVGPAEPARTVLARGRLGIGSLQHLALQLDRESFQQVERELQARGFPYTGPVDRGFAQVLYVRDPNGITLELTHWLTPLPTGVDQALVLKTAHRLREDEGASGIEDRHIQQVLATLYGSNGTSPVSQG